MKTDSEIRDYIARLGGDDMDTVLIPDGYPNAFLGVYTEPSGDAKPRAVYSASKIIERLSEDMGYEGAKEFFEFNIEGACIGEQSPMFIEGPPTA